MSEHTRRPGYWTYYHLGRGSETQFMIDTISNLVWGHPCPRQETSNRGRPPVHSRDKLDFICILMVAWHKTSRDMESDLSVIKMPWWTGEPVPDHTTIARHPSWANIMSEFCGIARRVGNFTMQYQLHPFLVLPPARRAGLRLLRRRGRQPPLGILPRQVPPKRRAGDMRMHVRAHRQVRVGGPAAALRRRIVTDPVTRRPCSPGLEPKLHPNNNVFSSVQVKTDLTLDPARRADKAVRETRLR